MPFVWFVALRYLRAARGQTALILAAVSVGVSVVVFLSALINGLQTSLIDKTLGSQPHVTMRVAREVPRPLTTATALMATATDIQVSAQRLHSIDQWPVIMTEAEHVPGVIAVSATVSGVGSGCHRYYFSFRDAAGTTFIDPFHGGRQLDLRQEVHPQQLRQDVSIDLVGLDPRVGDGLELRGIRDDDAIDVAAQDLDDRPAVEGRLEDDLVIALETPAEGFDGLRIAADSEVPARLAVLGERTDLEEVLVYVESVEHHSLRSESLGGRWGRTTRIYSRS